MGLDPAFHEGPESRAQADQARSETAASSGMFRGALERRRCLVHADAFYEWRTMPDGKQPYAIGRKDGAPLAFAGVWEGWRGPDGETLRSFAILTTAANATMQTLHDRMPVILEEEQWPVWLGEQGRGPNGPHAAGRRWAAAPLGGQPGRQQRPKQRPGLAGQD